MRKIALLTLLALSACSAGPRPTLPAAAGVIAPVSYRTETRDASVQADWWNTFGDPTLSQLVEATLANNSDIAIAASRVEEARAQLRMAESQTMPTLSFGANGGHSRDLNAFGQPMIQDSGKAQLAVAYDTDLFGRLSSATEGTRASLLATEASQANVRLAIAATTASAYIALRASDARLIVLTDTLKARTEALRLAKRRAGAGYSGSLEVQQAEAEYEAASQLIPVTLLAIRRQEDALSVLLGVTPRSPSRGLDLMSLTPPAVPAGLPSSLLRRRPDIFQAERMVVAADRSLDSARASMMPSVQLSATLGSVNSSLIDNPVGIFSLGGSILAPIWNGGRLKAQADVAATRRDQSAFAYQKTVLTAFREVEDGLAAENELAATERSLVNQRAALAKGLVLATERYDAGYSPYLEQIDAQRGLLSADLALIQAHSDRLTAAIALYQALGGGWSYPSGPVTTP